jgi:hypothetical protein
MALRDDIARRLAKKQQEIAGLESQIAELTQQLGMVKAYAQAMDEMLKLADRELILGSQPAEQPSLRKNSQPAKAYKALKAAGHPLHIVRLLEALGRPVNRTNRSTMSSALAAYYRKREIFTRPAPNTFGLVEWGELVNSNFTDSGSEGATNEGDVAPDDAPLMRLAR